MNWETLATIASLIAALGVLPSLLYLARQIRQASKATTASSMDSWLADYNAIVLELGRDGEFALLMRRGLRDFDALGGTDQFRFHAWMVSHLLNAQNLFMQLEQGTMHRDIADQILAFNAAMLKTPGGSRWWETARFIWRPAFVSHLDALISRAAPISDAWPFFLSECAPAKPADPTAIA
jgi:hypothetical protein